MLMLHIVFITPGTRTEKNVRYVDFRDSILKEFRKNSNGLIWAELKKRLGLPYTGPCQTWIRRMEQENGLYRVKGSGRAYLWKLPPG